jgi:hypothetical protein
MRYLVYAQEHEWGKPTSVKMILNCLVKLVAGYEETG